MAIKPGLHRRTREERLRAIPLDECPLPDERALDIRMYCSSWLAVQDAQLKPCRIKYSIECGLLWARPISSAFLNSCRNEHMRRCLPRSRGKAEANAWTREELCFILLYAKDIHPTLIVHNRGQ